MGPRADGSRRSPIRPSRRRSYDAADCLAYVWDADPTGHAHAFVQLVVGCAKHNGESTTSCSRVSEIKSFVPDAALRKLGPITKVERGQIKKVIQIGQYGQAHGIDTPELGRHLQAELEDDTDLLAGGDLWMELARACDTSILTNIEALRGAVKRLYSVPYGMKFSQVQHEILLDYAAYGGTYPGSHEPLAGLHSHPLIAELLETRETLREIIGEEHGLYDATGRFIPLSAWNETKDREDRWRGLMSYINASYETEIIGAAFEEAIKEKERDARTRFKIWLYQGDGFTIRVSSKASAQAQVRTLKQAVADKAEELGVPTELEVDWPE